VPAAIGGVGLIALVKQQVSEDRMNELLYAVLGGPPC